VFIESPILPITQKTSCHNCGGEVLAHYEIEDGDGDGMCKDMGEIILYEEIKNPVRMILASQEISAKIKVNYNHLKTKSCARIAIPASLLIPLVFLKTNYHNKYAIQDTLLFLTKNDRVFFY
jgi:hypothetical protein